MTLQQIATMVGTMATAIGGQYAYKLFSEGSAPNPPYILFYYPNNDDFVADNTNYVGIAQLNIEFYSDSKDFASEAKIEKTLNDNGLVFTKDESYLNDEKLYEVLYITEVVINEQQN